jgi:hypothetical protein
MSDLLLLSLETLKALKEFALDSGIAVVDDSNIIDSVKDHFEIKDKEQIFEISYTSTSNTIQVEFEVVGFKKELGQTLDSTGLTM